MQWPYFAVDLDSGIRVLESLDVPQEPSPDLAADRSAEADVWNALERQSGLNSAPFSNGRW